MTTRYHNPRIDEDKFDAYHGQVRFSVKKFFWLGGMALITVPLAVTHFSWAAFATFLLLTGFVLCFGHSLGMHRLFIHKSYKTYPYIRYFLVHLGTIVGITGPLSMLRTHDIRDWAQRQKKCHPYFSHKSPQLKDAYWQMLCDIHLENPPTLELEEDINNDKVIQWMEKYWMWQQLPWALVLFFVGGIGFVAWGVGIRVLVSNLGHWLIGYYAHNEGYQHFQSIDASTQGFNVKWVSLLTFGEGWHNNHHSFPNSAKFSVTDTEWDPGWWCLLAMKKLGLVWNLKTPEQLPYRSDLLAVGD